MASLAVGHEVRIPCEVSEGAFPGERLVTIDSAVGPVSGFVKEEEIVSSGGRSYLSGVVESVDDNTVTVRLRGSFFRTTGIAYLRKENLEQPLCA
jgi:hypothetical protein